MVIKDSHLKIIETKIKCTFISYDIPIYLFNNRVGLA